MNPARRLLMAALPVGGLVSGLAELGSSGLAPALHPDPARDAALRAMLPLVPALGWSVRALREAAGPDADLMFPGGPVEMVEAHSDLADREMAAAAESLTETRASRRVRALILLRLEEAERDRDAVRRGLSLLSLPGNRLVAARALARTSDTIWNAAGDVSTGFNRHSKRALLAGVYAATLLFWLRGGDPQETASFLDRRLAGIAAIGRLRARLSGAG